MKKFLKIFLIASIFLITGCGTKNADNILKDMEKKINNANSYYIEGVMEIINHEDTYNYKVKVSYQKQDYYKIELVNNLNNHEQVILRNDEGVYVVTPSLNKSFKFQSDWPYNNSQVYLLNSILEDLIEDEDREFKTKSDGYIFTSEVNYPNNKSLVRQNVYVDKNGKITKTEVVDKDGNAQIVMKFNKQEYNKKFDKKYFELSSLLEMNKKNSSQIDNDKEKKNNNNSTTNNENTETNNNTNNSTTSNNNNSNTEENKKESTSTETNNQNNTTNNQSNTNQNNNTNSNTTSNNSTNNKTTASINDIVYPMYLPDNTYLTNQERVNTKDGERLILTFSGDSSFVLVEETSKIEEENVVIPVIGEFDFLTDVIGIIGTHSLSWNSNGIDYYIASDVIETAELIEIARSISILPVSK